MITRQNNLRIAFYQWGCFLRLVKKFSDGREGVSGQSDWVVDSGAADGSLATVAGKCDEL